MSVSRFLVAVLCLLALATSASAEWIGLKTVSQVIHSYPTQADGIRKAGDAYNRTRLSPFLKTLSRRWLAWSR